MSCLMPGGPAGAPALRVVRMGIDTSQEFVIYMPREGPVCCAEGFTALSRVELRLRGRSLIATLNVVDGGRLAPDEAGLSNSAWQALGARPGDDVDVAHAPVLESMSRVRAKIYGHRLDAASLAAIVGDVAAGRYPDVHIAAFLTACAGGRMDVQETIELTRAMVEVGECLAWPGAVTGDKHCVGGLPGNRTTPIVVAIAAAAGLVVPKTSSRAITSPAGTADVMETMAPVALDLPTLRRVVSREGGCLAWGGALALSPADDVLIRVERPLDLDSDAQLVASVLSKKIAAGSTHVLLDVPVGPTAKVRGEADFVRLKALLEVVAQAHGLHARVLRSDGTQPVGRGMGPALEAHDVLAVLQGRADAPADLRDKGVALAAALLEFCGRVPAGEGPAVAARLLAQGAAWRKFLAICEAQGGFREPPRAALREPALAQWSGRVTAMDSRRLARLAALAGAPNVAVAGLELHVKLGQRVAVGQPLLTLHAQARGELDYARQYLAASAVFTVEREE
ncbi:thymidine phosphorylase family protein [Azohydromonas lata]|uniref:Putative thymidine phosphorylase n=1 Tax=Azohydromonas lata TaxID=45677 RepID=A0ABU5IQA3_9BURK|nr:thymidine phosphorylase family protein [Azohydromonas lata]MDZ5461076.1 thymidine phosphorylase family protein [Azohydromonas lata]